MSHPMPFVAFWIERPSGYRFATTASRQEMSPWYIRRLEGDSQLDDEMAQYGKLLAAAFARQAGVDEPEAESEVWEAETETRLALASASSAVDLGQDGGGGKDHNKGKWTGTVCGKGVSKGKGGKGKGKWEGNVCGKGVSKGEGGNGKGTWEGNVCGKGVWKVKGKAKGGKLFAGGAKADDAGDDDGDQAADEPEGEAEVSETETETRLAVAAASSAGNSGEDGGGGNDHNKGNVCGKGVWVWKGKGKAKGKSAVVNGSATPFRQCKMCGYETHMYKEFWGKHTLRGCILCKAWAFGSKPKHGRGGPAW